MTPFIYNAEQYDIYIGNDVDQRSFSLNIRERFKRLSTKTMPAHPEKLYNFIKRQYPEQRVVVGYEAGPTGFGLYDYLRQRNMGCVLISPASVRRPASERVKTNRIDSNKLAMMLAEGDINPVRVPEGSYRELRNLVHTRENYAKARRTAKQRIKALLLYVSIPSPEDDSDRHWSSRYLQYLKTLECTPAVRFRLDRLLDDLDYSRRQLLKATRQLREFCQASPDIAEHLDNLRSIPGIGPVTAATILGRVGDPQYLQDQRELSSFCGLVPRENSTGKFVRRGSITRSGNGQLRALLVEAAWRAIRKETELEQFYHRIVGRHPAQYAKQKAIVAVAHKLTLRIYRVLVERRKYIVH